MTFTSPSSTRTGNVSTGSTAGSESGRPVQISIRAPWRGQTATPSSSVELALAERPVVVRAAVLDRAVARRPGCRRRPRSAPAWTIFTVPGGSSSTGATTMSAKAISRSSSSSPAHSCGSGVPLARWSATFSTPEPEQRALEPHRRQRDADLLEQVLLRQLGDLGRRPALDHLHQHRGRRLADRAAAAGELDLVDRLAVLAELDVDRDLVAAERVQALGLRVGVLDHPVPARVLVVVEDDFAVEVFHGYPRIFRALCRPSASRSISSGTV